MFSPIDWVRNAAKEFSGYASWSEDLDDRIVDLLVPFSSFSVYYPSQHGRAKLKVVLPALTGKSYDDLEISGGMQASDEFMRITFGDVEDADRAEVRKNLEEYCGLDTMGRVDIVGKVSRMAMQGKLKGGFL